MDIIVSKRKGVIGLMNKNSVIIREFAITSLFAAIIFLMAFTPIGFIQLGVIKATLIHIPVIIGSIILGPKKGALLGALFGLTSLIINTISPSLLSFVFSPLIPVPGLGRGSVFALLICFVPRILVGVVPYYVYKFLEKFKSDDKKFRLIALFTSGVAGSLTNTLLVMNLIYIIFKNEYAFAKNMDPQYVYGFILSIIAMHGIPEAIVAGLAAAAVVKAVTVYMSKNSLQSDV